MLNQPDPGPTVHPPQPVDQDCSDRRAPVRFREDEVLLAQKQSRKQFRSVCRGAWADETVDSLLDRPSQNENPEKAVRNRRGSIRKEALRKTEQLRQAVEVRAQVAPDLSHPAQAAADQSTFTAAIEAIRDGLTALPADLASVLSRKADGASTTLIAEEFQIGERQVRNRIAQARTKLLNDDNVSGAVSVVSLFLSERHADRHEYGAQFAECVAACLGLEEALDAE